MSEGKHSIHIGLTHSKEKRRKKKQSDQFTTTKNTKKVVKLIHNKQRTAVKSNEIGQTDAQQTKEGSSFQSQQTNEINRCTCHRSLSQTACWGFINYHAIIVA